MIALISAIFIASLLGSMHCAGMCGAFVAFAVADQGGQSRQPSRAALNAAYNGGRLVTYAALGLLAGTLGAAMDLGGSMVGVQRTAAITAGVLMIAFGVLAILRQMRCSVGRLPIPSWLHNALIAGHRAAFELPPIARAGLVGLLTTLLPCGWLYAFAITAAGTGSPWLGALTMTVFWLGTLPIMLAMGTGVQALTGVLRPHLPLLTSLLIVCVGTWTALGRMNMPQTRWRNDVASCNVQDAVLRVESIDSTEMPCCHAK